MCLQSRPSGINFDKTFWRDRSKQHMLLFLSYRFSVSRRLWLQGSQHLLGSVSWFLRVLVSLALLSKPDAFRDWLLWVLNLFKVGILLSCPVTAGQMCGIWFVPLAYITSCKVTVQAWVVNDGNYIFSHAFLRHLARKYSMTMHIL